MKKRDKFLDAMGHIDDSIIDEYANSGSGGRMPTWAKILSIAASVVVVLTVSIIIYLNGGLSPEVPDDGTATQQTLVPEEKPDGPFKVLSVTADKVNGNFVSGDTTFTVKTENGSADAVREHLFISTAPEYTVTEIAEDTYQILLSGGVADNTVVSLSYVEDGIIDTSWAFQTESKLSLSGSYPADGADTVSVNTVIELEFSYSATEGVEEAVTFEPAITGKWEHAGKIWRFIPDAPLEKDSTYIINVGKGITADGKEMETTASVTFSTFEKIPYNCSPSLITVDGINYYRPEDDIYIKYNNRTTNTDVGSISLKKFGSHEDMTAFIGGETDITISDFSEAEFTVEKVTYSDSEHFVLLKLSEKLPQGYYVARAFADDGVHLFDWVIQVHPLSVYATTSERDILLWIAEDGKLAKGIKAKIGDAEGESGEDGTLILRDVTDGSGDIRYIYI